MSNYLEPKIVERKKLGLFEHPGLRIMVAGRLMVIHNSFREGKVVISTIEEYAENHEVVESTRYKPQVTGYQMEALARQLLGKPWKPWYNCQHFITEIAGLPSHSPQMNEIFAVVGACFLIVAIAKG